MAPPPAAPNTATGYQALPSNNVGSGNTAIGALALPNNTTGNDNIALGDAAGLFLTTGDNNIDIGNNGVAGDFDTTRIGSIQGAIYLAGIARSDRWGGWNYLLRR